MDNNNKTIIKNSIFMYLRMILLLVISLFTSREVLRYLGIEDYGIYNVIGGVVSFVAFFNNTLQSSTQRFLNVELGTPNGDVQKVFNASFQTHLILAAILVIAMEIGGLWFVNNKINIPSDRMYAALWAFHTSIALAAFQIIRTPYNAVIIAYEKMSVYAYTSILEAIAKLVIIYILAIGLTDSLVLYSVLNLFIAIIITIIYYIYCRRNFKETSLSLEVDKNLLKNMGGFIGWSTYGGLSMWGYTQGLNMLINIYFGPAINAARGIAVQIESMVKQFRNNFQVAVNPQLVKSYAESDMNRFFKLFAFSAKFSTYIMLAMFIPIYFRIDWLLNLWLVEVPEYTADILRIILLACLIDSAVTPFVMGIQANGNIKIHEIICGSLLLLIIPVSYVFLEMGYSPLSVFWVYTIVMAITQLARIGIFCSLLKVSYAYVVKLIYLNISLVSISAFLIGYILDLIIQGSVIGNLSYYAIAFLTTIVCSYLFGLNRREKGLVLNNVKNILNKLKR